MTGRHQIDAAVKSSLILFRIRVSSRNQTGQEDGSALCLAVAFIRFFFFVSSSTLRSSPKNRTGEFFNVFGDLLLEPRPARARWSPRLASPGSKAHGLCHQMLQGRCPIKTRGPGLRHERLRRAFAFRPAELGKSRPTRASTRQVGRSVGKQDSCFIFVIWRETAR
jgi:hypothetical protein